MAKKKKAAGSSSRKTLGLEKAKSVISRRNQNGTVILMATYKTGSFFKIDGVAAEIWAALEAPRTLPAIVEHFTKRYPTRASSLPREIDQLVKRLVKHELLSESKGPFNAAFPAPSAQSRENGEFGNVQEYDLLQIESEVLNESIYLDVFAGSDLRLKSDVKPIRSALAKVVQLDGVTYRWNTKRAPREKVNTKARHAGLIAQQVAMHMPELVRSDRETGNLAIEYRKLNSYLVEAIKDLNRTLVAQERRIRALEKPRTRKLAASAT